MSRVARLAFTSRCMLPRIWVTPAWYCLKPDSSSPSLPRSSGSLTRATRMASLPWSSPCTRSRKVLVSLPSRNATSGSTTSPASMAFAFFAMRWVSITRCAVIAFCRVLPPDCTLSAAISSASSRSAGLLSLIARTAAPRATRLRSSAITRPALRSVLCHCASSVPSSGRTRSGVGGSVTPLATPPAPRSFTTAANSSRLSRSCLKATALPCEACCAAFASRCESMRTFPTAAT